MELLCVTISAHSLSKIKTDIGGDLTEKKFNYYAFKNLNKLLQTIDKSTK